MLTWPNILRLGLVQAALGSIVVLTTATMNRVMTVELAMPAVLPGLLVSVYYATQFLRPRFGHGADRGGRRTPWIMGGVAVLALGAIAAALAVNLMAASPALGIAAAVPAFVLIGLGIGSAGTNLLALLAIRVAPDRQAAAGSAVWILMIAGLAVTGIAAGKLLDPYSPARLVAVTGGVCALALALTLSGLWRQEPRAAAPPPARDGAFAAVARAIWADPRARGFTLFVFASMTAYNLQDLILEPFGGHVFGMTVGESTALGGQHHAGALTGMLAVLGAGLLPARVQVPIRVWISGGCLLSGAALLGLAAGAQAGPGWPIGANVFALGLANGAFAVAAVGAMMSLAREDGEARAGARMGVFGAAQAIGFGIGSFAGTVLADMFRLVTGSHALGYGAVFLLESLIFLVAALIALRLAQGPMRHSPAQTAAIGG
jgi:BCD family chlorophyll transporter-like MFS transporter